MRHGHSFDDILLVPQYSEVDSRKTCSIDTYFYGKTYSTPLMPANMDTVCGLEMLETCMKINALGFMHRYMALEKQLEDALKALKSSWPENYGVLPITIGVNTDIDKLLSLLSNCDPTLMPMVLIDVAHGDSRRVLDTIRLLRDHVPVLAGNVCTADAVLRIIDSGAVGVKIGVGSGSICSTRLITGHGVPQATAIKNADSARNLRRLAYSEFAIVADGGFNYYGDLAKAIALGANFVMSGKLFAGCTETPGKTFMDSQSMQLRKIYRGMASYDAQSDWHETAGNGSTPEGVSFVVPARGSAMKVFSEAAGALRSAMSYSGVTCLKDLYLNSEIITQTASGLRESQTRS